MVINDIGVNILPDNYYRYLIQYSPNTTSRGYWRVEPGISHMEDLPVVLNRKKTRRRCSSHLTKDSSVATAAHKMWR